MLRNLFQISFKNVQKYTFKRIPKMFTSILKTF